MTGTGNRMRGVLGVLLAVAAMGGCQNRDEQAIMRADENFIPLRHCRDATHQAAVQNVDYPYMVQRAYFGNEKAMRSLLALRGLDARGAQQHTEVLMGLLGRFGDEEVTRVLAQGDDTARQYVSILVRRRVDQLRADVPGQCHCACTGWCDGIDRLDEDPGYRRTSDSHVCHGGKDRFCWHCSNHHVVWHCPNHCNSYCKLDTTYPKLYKLSRENARRYSSPQVAGLEDKPGL